MESSSIYFGQFWFYKDHWLNNELILLMIIYKIDIIGNKDEESVLSNL